MMLKIPDDNELCAILGKSFEAFTLLDGYIDCFYQADAVWGKGDKHGAYAIRYRQAGKTLCTVYINKGYFTVLFVYGKQDQETFESSEYHVNRSLQDIYDNTHIYPEGKWIWIDIYDAEFLEDIEHFLSVKRKPDKKAMTMCGIKCNLCKAYIKNIKKNDQREQLSAIWKKYFCADIPKEQICCDGCRCEKSDAKRADADCPVRKCVIKRHLLHCGECPEFPCGTFRQREGLCYNTVKKQDGTDFDAGQFREYLLAYDNKTRLQKYLTAFP